MSKEKIEPVNLLRFLKAARLGKLTDLILNLPKDLDAQDEYSFNALMYAVTGNHIEVVEYLLKHEANPNVCSSLGITPLMMAAQIGSERIVALLLTHHADIRVKTPSPYRDKFLVSLFYPRVDALFFAVKNGHSAVAQILIKHGADINALFRKKIELRLSLDSIRLREEFYHTQKKGELNPNAPAFLPSP